MLNIPRLPIYGNDTLKLALEFGVVLSEAAKEIKVELTSETTENAQKIFINEIKTKGYKKTALNFVPLILAALEK